MSGIDSEDGRKSVEIQEYEYFLYFGRNGIVWFEDVSRKGLAIDIIGKHWEVLQFCFRILIKKKNFMVLLVLQLSLVYKRNFQCLSTEILKE